MTCKQIFKFKKVCKLVIGNWNFQSGYTLIEILVGLTIISLLFGFGYASFRDFSRRQTLVGTAKSVQGDLRLAQEFALAGQKPDDVSCNSPETLDSYSFKVYSASQYKIEADCTGGAAGIVYKDVNLSPDITLSTPSVNPIKFKVIGTGTNIPSGQSTTITLTQSGTNAQLVITVGSGGEIK